MCRQLGDEVFTYVEQRHTMCCRQLLQPRSRTKAGRVPSQRELLTKALGPMNNTRRLLHQPQRHRGSPNRGEVAVRCDFVGERTRCDRAVDPSSCTFSVGGRFQQVADETFKRVNEGPRLTDTPPLTEPMLHFVV